MARTAKQTGTRINKSQWIRAQPRSLSAREVVDKAKAEGISLTLPQVYTARSTAKDKGAKPLTAAAPAGRTRSVKRAKDDLQHQFTSLAMRLGTDEAQRVLDTLVRRQVG
jgi:hypothetical protein